MKIFTTILIVLAFALIIFNITLLDFEKPFEGNSMIAMIGIVAAFCAVFILLIFKMSKKIEDKLKNQ
jgi:heme/copper-type cytochrome/quinol oxidase subunit 2